jgi:STAS domain
MQTSALREAPGGGLFGAAQARPGSWRQAELAELEHSLRSAIMSTLAEASRPPMIASLQRGDEYAAVAVGGPVGRRAVVALGANLRGLLEAGARHIVVDLSNITDLDEGLAALMHRVEARTLALGGVFELTGLTPRVLYGMDDDPLARVFARHRAALEDGSPHELSWAVMSCPLGLDEVAEPHTAARHRCIIDTGGATASRVIR